jgi:hypothetical protein
MNVVDLDGSVVHEWNIDWFDRWSDATHLPPKERPKQRPGTHPHGVVFTERGDVVFNFERKGMISLDICGAVNWRVAKPTHHAVHWDPGRQSYWTLSKVFYSNGPSPYPNLVEGFEDDTIVEVNTEGQVVREFSLIPLLIESGLGGLLYLSTLNNWGTPVSGDILHVNDVETFPARLKPGVFEAGDVMVSIRNINAILVLDGATLAVKFVEFGKVLRQHDPDFLDGDTISVLDNNNLWARRSPQEGTKPPGLSSRVITINARYEDVQTLFKGTADDYFFTSIMGKHQWLPNGNLLLTESVGGRVLEVTRNGEVIWEFLNLVEPDIVGMMSDAVRLPPQFDKGWFHRAQARCLSQ